MQKKAIQYYKQGYNCSQCILKAAESRFRLSLSEKDLNMCSAVNTGFGIGCFCSVLIAGIMVFGLLFDEATAKRLRMKLLNEFSELHDSVNCSVLKKERKEGQRCEGLIYEIAGLVEKIVEDELA